VDRAILWKFDFERDLNIAKRVLLPKPKPGVDFQLHMTAIFKILEIDMTYVSVNSCKLRAGCRFLLILTILLI